MKNKIDEWSCNVVDIIIEEFELKLKAHSIIKYCKNEVNFVWIFKIINNLFNSNSMVLSYVIGDIDWFVIEQELLTVLYLNGKVETLLKC